jgi:hypothetical protein
MGFQTRGKLEAVFDARQVTERFRVREFALELTENPSYPQFVMFQLTGDRCEKLDDFALGDEVEVEFSIRGRKWTSPQDEVKYFNSLDAWEIRGAQGSENSIEEPPPPSEPPPGSDQDVPF